MNLNTFQIAYPYFVVYEENGQVSSDKWSAKTLADELLKGEVKILSAQYFGPEEDD